MIVRGCKLQSATPRPVATGEHAPVLMVSISIPNHRIQQQIAYKQIKGVLYSGRQYFRERRYVWKLDAVGAQRLLDTLHRMLRNMEGLLCRIGRIQLQQQ